MYEPPHWNPADIGCIERDSFRLHPVRRTALTALEPNPARTKKADVRAPITASFEVRQNRAQWSAWTQWYRYDLAGGALAFTVDLWLWNRVRRVCARIQGGVRSQRVSADIYVLGGTFEIEREGIQ
jgi:hypothetical protein